MGGVALHRLHQIGDQVVALLQLHVDVGEGLVGPLPEAHQAVVDAGHDQPGDDDDDDQDEGDAHGGFLAIRSKM